MKSYSIFFHVPSCTNELISYNLLQPAYFFQEPTQALQAIYKV